MIYVTNELTMSHTICLIISILTTLPLTLGKSFVIEIESVLLNRDPIFRANASNTRSNLFMDGETLRVDFCLKQSSPVTLSDVVFSNDGRIDTISIMLDGEQLGSFETVSNTNFGHNWNSFRSSGQIGSQQELSAGRHVLKFTLTTDSYGVELDVGVLEVGDETLDEGVFRCMAVCNSAMNSSNIKARDDMPSAELVQQSVPAICVRDRNIYYPIFHESVTEYRLTATLPMYRTLLNNGVSDSVACETVSDVFWEFTDFTVIPTSTFRTAEDAEMTFGGTYTNREIIVTFKLEKDESFIRQSDEDVGAILTLTFDDSAPDFTARLDHTSRTGDKSDVAPTSTDGPTVTWNISDFTWMINAINNIKVRLVVEEKAEISVESLKLERRPKRPDVVITIYEGAETKVEGVREDQWWRAPLGMAVRRSDQPQSMTYENITRITVSKLNRFTTGFNEVFQLYQDGLTNSKSRVPLGATSIPYGSSFVFGQFNSSDKRPYAAISTVIIDPFALKLILGYVNTNIATLEINSKLENTEVHLTGATFAKNRSVYPIAAVRSMWVSDGNADLDHVSANQNIPRPAVGRWKKLYGTAFAFFRQCVSDHNTQGPDLVLELLNDEST